MGGQSVVDPATGIMWTNKYEEYLQAATHLKKDGVITTANVTLNVSGQVYNAEQLKTALIFLPMARDSSRTQRSKFCFNFSVEYNTSGEVGYYVLRAMFPSSNLSAKDPEGKLIPVDDYSKRFYFSVDSTEPGYDRATTRGIAIDTSYLITVSRLNFGGERMPHANPSSLRFPEDPFDRLWSIPQLTDRRVQAVRNNTFVNLTLDNDEIHAPSEVLTTAWEAKDITDNITFTWDLVDSRRPTSRFYWNIVFCELFRLAPQTRAVNIEILVNKSEDLRTDADIKPKPFMVYSSGWTFDANVVTVTVSANVSSDLPPLVNMAELLGIFSAVVDRTVDSDGKAVGDLAMMTSDGLALDSTGDPCLPIPWAWLVCSMETPPRVTEINVTSKGIHGNLPDSFSGLDRLTVLDLSFNDLGPSTDHLKVLRYLSSLRDLRLDSNGFQGPVPSLRPGSLGNLQRLSVSSNSLSGEISSLLQAMDATVSNLNLSRNNLSSYIPFEIIEANLTGLESLDLSHNNFSGNVNLNTSKLSNLQTLILKNNQLEGTVPSSIWDLGKLEFVDLQENNFTKLDLRTWCKSISGSETNSSSNLKVHLMSNQIDNILLDQKTMQLGIQGLHLDRNAIILLGGNPWCTRHKGSRSSKVLVRYLCRSDETQDYKKYRDHGISNNILIAIIIPCALLLIGIWFILICFLWKIRRRAVELRKVQDALTKEQVKPRFYDYDELKAATNNFSSKNVLGRGAFGTVYKAELVDGSILAVKRLNPTEQNISDFIKEIVNISGIKHRHFIQLKGCCVRDKQLRILVYEFAENRSLAEALGPGKPFVLSWQQRFKICLGIARGLAYLNEELQPRMIHRDIKPQNILLDKDYNAKIADFGLVRPSKVDHTSVTITIGGTKGYIPPEYVSEGFVSEKLDVYSLGIVLLEIVSGRLWVDLELPTEQVFLRNWAVTLFDEGKLLDLVDKELNGKYNEEEVLRVLQTAIACCQMDSKKRPTMSQIVNVLMSHADPAVDIVQGLRGKKPHCLENIWEEESDQNILKFDDGSARTYESEVEDQALISSRSDLLSSS
ncbi:hypothetical protein R1sor_005477 [Riccia sorocarpa]|uniref:Protein kinase domain-containing protein n=1 Tax=Riccia sorocarpa TaxID=122646 RepID=A0ABD3HNZ3_9MARC